MSIHCLGRPASPIRNPSAGGFGLAVRSWPLRLSFFPSTFLRFAPDDALLPACFHPSYPPFAALLLCLLPRACEAPQGVRGSERPSVAIGLSLVPWLYSEEKLTGAPFRRWAQYNCCRHYLWWCCHSYYHNWKWSFIFHTEKKDRIFAKVSGSATPQ